MRSHLSGDLEDLAIVIRRKGRKDQVYSLEAVRRALLEPGASVSATYRSNGYFDLTPAGIVLNRPSVGHAFALEPLAATGLAIGSPVTGTPYCHKSLFATDKTTGSPALGTPTATRYYVFAAGGIAISSPVVGPSGLPWMQEHA